MVNWLRWKRRKKPESVRESSGRGEGKKMSGSKIECAHTKSCEIYFKDSANNREKKSHMTHPPRNKKTTRSGWCNGRELKNCRLDAAQAVAKLSPSGIRVVSRGEEADEGERERRRRKDVKRMDEAKKPVFIDDSWLFFAANAGTCVFKELFRACIGGQLSGTGFNDISQRFRRLTIERALECARSMEHTAILRCNMERPSGNWKNIFLFSLFRVYNW